MFNIGDCVVYGLNGVCTIEDIREELFAGEKGTYYILKQKSSTPSTIFLPTNKAYLVERMRKLMSRDEAESFISALGEITPVAWIEENRRRSEKFKSILDKADKAELASMIKAIYEKRQKQRENGKKLFVADENAFQKAEYILHSELACVLGIPYETVPCFIKQKLEA